jgi:predicted negative regulator of RcsB-dependent stress response
MNGKSILIGALIIAVAVLGYLYWDSQNNTIVKVPGVTIKKN